MLEAVFACTLEIINKDLEAYPDHRITFFQMLSAIDRHCFNVLIALPDTTLVLVIQAIVWAFKHSMRNVAELGKLTRSHDKRNYHHFVLQVSTFSRICL